MNFIYFRIIDEEKPQGKTLYFSPYLYVTNRKSSSALYSLPSAEKSLFFSLMLQFCRFFTHKKCSKKKIIIIITNKTMTNKSGIEKSHEVK